jgi:glycolate oxidase iron-sulfur subunit
LLARPLLQNKIKNLEAGQPDLIATANISCYSFLQQAASVPVKHWIELLDP